MVHVTVSVRLSEFGCLSIMRYGSTWEPDISPLGHLPPYEKWHLRTFAPKWFKGEDICSLIKCKMVDICPLLKNKGRTFAPFPPSNKYPCQVRTRLWNTLYVYLGHDYYELFMPFTPREQCKEMLASLPSFALIESIRKYFLLCSNCLIPLNLHDSIPDLFILPWLLNLVQSFGMTSCTV